MIEWFTDPILRGPIWGACFMSIAASLMGVIFFLRKQCLVAEVLSHAAFPGAVLGAVLGPQPLGVFIGASISSFLGLKVVNVLQSQKQPADTSFVFVLSVFFGIGTLFFSWVQALTPQKMRGIYALLFGQAATMGDEHLMIYAPLAGSLVLFLWLQFRPLQIFLFDPTFAELQGYSIRKLERILVFFLVFSVILGIRSVGVVLISSMVIAPAIAARQWTHHLSTMFWIAAFVGVVSALLGTVISVKFSQPGFILPMGPMIVLVVSVFALASLLFAPERGRLFLWVRSQMFYLRCIEENLMKTLWKLSHAPFEGLKIANSFTRFFLLWRLRRKGWIIRRETEYFLSEEGIKRGAYLVRLHRLWEVYLTSSLGARKDQVHWNAEEIEHILTPELEEKLSVLLDHPQEDPHTQIIPEKPKNL